MSIYKKYLIGSGATFGLLMSAAGTANAQTSGQKYTVQRFDEIIVTARKREENIQETPLSISAFTSDMIETAGIRDMADIAKYTPGFVLDDEFGRTSGVRPVIRGQSTILGASGVSTFVDGILLNGSILDYDLTDVQRVEVVKGPQSALYGRNTYSGSINIITKSPSDEASADIKLDAGSFGRTEIAGTLRGPVSDVVSASLHGRWFKRAGPFLNTFDGSKVGQQESLAGSLVVYYEPTGRFSARTRVRVSKLNDDQPRLFATDPSENNLFPDDGGTYLGNGRYFGGEITNRPIAYDDVRQLGEKGFEKTEALQASVAMNYVLSDTLDVEFINGFNTDATQSKFDFDHRGTSLAPFAVYIGPVFPFAFGPNPAPSSFAHAYVIADPTDFASVGKSTTTDRSHELRINYDGGARGWRAMLGGYYYQGDNKGISTRRAPPALNELLTEGFAAQEARMRAQCAVHANDAALRCFRSPAFGFDAIFNFGSTLEQLTFTADRSVQRGDRRNLAAFGSFDIDIFEDLTLTAEARYKSERVVDNTIVRSAIYDYNGTQTDFIELPETTRTATFNSFNPRFTAKYQINDNMNIYAIAARGDKPGGFNNVNAIPIGFGTFGEETVWAFEAGVKNTLLDGQLLLNLTGYNNTISDYQLTQSVTLPNNITSTVISNVGKVRVRGIEAELIYRMPYFPGLMFNANYALADSQITQGTDLNEGRHLDVADDRSLNCSLGRQDPSQACSADNVLFGSIAGRQLPRSPKNTFNLGMNYSRALTDSLELNFNTNVSYESKKYVQVHNLAFVGSNTLVNGSIGLSSGSLSFTIWGRNLTNEDAVVSAQRFVDPNQSFQRAFVGNPRLPREFGATVRKSF
jgi:iron complex outermembrane recepter protein